MMERLLCLVGLHRWQLSRPLAAYDIWPDWEVPYQNPHRDCVRCGRRQWWTPPNYASHDDPGYWADAPHAKGKDKGK